MDGGDDFWSAIPVCLYEQEMRQREFAWMPLMKTTCASIDLLEEVFNDLDFNDHPEKSIVWMRLVSP